MIRAVKIMALSAVLALTLCGCVGVNISGASHSTAQGKGALNAHTFEVGVYDSVRINGNFVVVYSSEASSEITIDIQDNLVEYVNVSSKDGMVTIDARRDFSTGQNQTPIVTLRTPTLEYMEVAGAVVIEEADLIAGDTFFLEVSGAGYAHLNLQVKELSVTMAGAGALDLSGTADKANIEIAGVGSCEAFALKTRTANVEIAGMGTASISCSDELVVDIGGMGSLEYMGTPEVIADATMFSNIQKVG